MGGSWIAGGAGRLQSINPTTGEAVGVAEAADAEIVDGAVRAAREAFRSADWAGLRAADRAAALLKLAGALEAREAEVGELIAREMGKPVRVSRGREVGGAVDRLRYFAGAARTLDGRFTAGAAPDLWDMEIPEPVGVCALIVPWNDPVDLAVRKLGAALAVGCTVVLKPSELTPASTSALVELAHETGAFPDGVLNMVHGPGETTGEALVKHPDVDKISFTGGTETGMRIMTLAAGRLAKVSLECGGKAPAVVFADADLGRCADALTYGAFMYGGQSCTACTRLLVEDVVHDELVDAIASRSQDIPFGNPLDPGVLVGPMVSREQFDKAVGYIERGIADGGRPVVGGVPADRDSLFLPPTILVDVPADSPLATEEVFGPVLAVHRFKEEDEAVASANATQYGLGGSVWSADLSRALRVSRRLDVADVWVNTYYVRHAETSFGGRHLSGIGREMGRAGLEEYVAWKRVCIDTRDTFHLREWFEEGEGFRG